MENAQTTRQMDESNRILEAILIESFRHWRYIENLRQGFTAVWAAIVAGVLAFISQTENFLVNIASIPALIFLILLTFLGFLMSIRLSNNIEPCEHNIRETLTNANFAKYDPTRGWEKGITRHFRLRRFFVLSYFVALIFLVSLVVLILVGIFRQN
jgi:hypothetical protein